MARLVFFRQARIDGGIRTGIDADGTRLWESFQPGNQEEDPALLWYIDLRCEGDDLPMEGNPARDWFVARSAMVKEAFAELAEKLAIGLDDEDLPYQFQVRSAPTGVSMHLACSCVRGMNRGELARILRQVGRTWKQVLAKLEPAKTVSVSDG